MHFDTAPIASFKTHHYVFEVACRLSRGVTSTEETKMRKIHLAMALALVQAAALGCADGAGGIAAPDGPARFDVGPTTRVAVTCPDTIEATHTAQCTASGYDADNNLTGSSVSAWATSNAAKVSVTSGGVVGGVATGSAQVSATMSGVIGSGTVVVVPDGN
jgi:hypothetical protein